MPVLIEVLLLNADADAVAYRVVRGPLTDDAAPDDTALHLCGLDGGADVLLHSTSWRHEDGTVVLTYVLVPDSRPDVARRPVPRPASSRHGLATDCDSELDAVATHACRHLAFLRVTDSEVRHALRRWPRVGALLRDFTPDVAGELADEEARG